GGRIGRAVYLFEAEKNKIYILTVVDRATHCLLSWDVVRERSTANLQACLERAPQARQYYSDAFPAYDNLYYGAPYEMRSDKKETYSVEAVNTDLRHYMKRLARKSRCFSRRLEALLRNLQLFAYCYNQRQLMKQKYPQYNLPLIDFLYPSMMDTPFFYFTVVFAFSGGIINSIKSARHLQAIPIIKGSACDHHLLCHRHSRVGYLLEQVFERGEILQRR